MKKLEGVGRDKILIISDIDYIRLRAFLITKKAKIKHFIYGYSLNTESDIILDFYEKNDPEYKRFFHREFYLKDVKLEDKKENILQKIKGALK